MSSKLKLFLFLSLSFFIIRLPQSAFSMDNETYQLSIGFSGSDNVYVGPAKIIGDYLYIAGRFRGTIDLDPTDIVESYTAQGSSNEYDFFLSKYDLQGNYYQSYVIGGVRDDDIKLLKVDPNGGFYISGRFKDTVDFDPTATVEDHSSNNTTEDAYISKYNSDGNYLWTKTLSCNGHDYINDIKFDSQANIYTVGAFENTCDLDMTTGVDNHTSVSSSPDVYISKYDSDFNYVWSKSVGGSGQDSVFSLDIDSDNNVYYTGYFNDTVDFDPGPSEDNHATLGTYNTFVSKLDSDGNYVWTKSLSSTSVNYTTSLRVSQDHFYIYGKYFNTVDFDPSLGVTNYTSNGGYDIFFSKYDLDGNHIWTNAFGSSTNDSPIYMTIGQNGGFYLTGYAGYNASSSDTIDFNPRGTPDVLSIRGGSDIFLQKLSDNGSYLWTKMTGGAGQDWPYYVSAYQDHLLLTGVYKSTTIDLDLDPITEDTLTGNSTYYSAFVSIYTMDYPPSNVLQHPSSTNPPFSFCSDQKPVVVPQLFQIDIVRPDQAILYFAPSSSQLNGYQVKYGLVDNPQATYSDTFDSSFSSGVLSREINHLSPNSNYYFQIRAKDNCALGDWSNALKINTNKASKFYLFK